MERSRVIYFSLIIVASCVFASFGTDAEAVSDAVGSTVAPTPTPIPTPKPIKEEEGIFRVDTELVNINVRVIDRNSRPVGGLKRSDFTVTEDGVTQEIEYFSQSEVPTNYSLVVDNSGSLRRQLDKVIEAGKILVNTNKPEDETLIIRF